LPGGHVARKSAGAGATSIDDVLERTSTPRDERDLMLLPRERYAGGCANAGTGTCDDDDATTHLGILARSCSTARDRGLGLRPVPQQPPHDEEFADVVGVVIDHQQ
jgi:hypothetical protein